MSSVDMKNLALRKKELLSEASLKKLLFKKLLVIGGLLLVISSSIAVSPAMAASSSAEHRATQYSAYSSQGWNSQWMLAKGGPISLEDAVKKAKRKHKGKVLSAKKIESKGPLVYKIKMIMPDSRVKTVFVDGDSGDLIKRDR